MKFSKKLAAAGAAAAAILGGMAACGPRIAWGSTPGCVSGAYSGYCGTQADHDAVPVAFDVFKRAARAGQPVIAWPDSSADPATDWFTYAYAGGPSKVFDYAPGGQVSNWCLSEPGPLARLVLRACNGSKWQRWTAAPSGSGYTWANAATGDIITSYGQGAQLAGTVPPQAVTGAQQWSFAS